jgi:membrane associated rhomboid family serine protease
VTGPLRTHGPLSRGVFAVVVLVSLAVLFAPGSDVPSAPAGVDKVVHGGLFAALALSGRWAGIGRPVLAGLLVLYAAVSELIQGIPGLDRDPAVGDWVADVVGVLIGLLVWDLLGRRATRA